MDSICLAEKKAISYIIHGWSYSFTGVGQDREYLELAMKPEGRVHFAGEHTSPFRASMNGAIESGLRACEEIRRLLNQGDQRVRAV